MKKHPHTLIFSVVLFAVLGSTAAMAEPSGFVGRTSKTVGGCGFCHGTNPSAETTLTLEGTSTPKVLPGSTTTFTVVVAHSMARLAGVNIAVMTTPTGTDPIGELSVISGQITRRRDGEITHSSPKSFKDGHVSYSFNWTAPMDEGTYYLQAVGNACNGDGLESEQDLWNFLEPVPINVSTANSVGHADMLAPFLIISPNPIFIGSRGMVRGLPNALGVMKVIAASGEIVMSVVIGESATSVPIELPDVPSGMYVVAIESKKAVRFAPLMVIR